MSDTRPVITIPTSALDALSTDAQAVLRNALRPVTARERETGVDASIVRLVIMQRYAVPQAVRIEAVTALFRAIGFTGTTTAVPPSVRVRIEDTPDLPVWCATFRSVLDDEHDDRGRPVYPTFTREIPAATIEAARVDADAWVREHNDCELVDVEPTCPIGAAS